MVIHLLVCSKQQKRMKGNKTVTGYVKCYINLCYLFDSDVIMFINHMVHIEYLSSQGHYTKWPQSFLMKRMNFNRRIFEKCVKQLTDMDLLKVTKAVNKCFLTFEITRYEKLVEILNSHTDVFVMKEFCKRMFVEQKRSIDSITKKEIEALANTYYTFR